MSRCAEGRFVVASWGASVRSALEYRASSATQAVCMLLNNLFFLSFWGIFFARFQAVKGWTMEEQALLYGIVATGFGLAAVLAGGSSDLAGTIAAGGLDSWLLRPRTGLLQALVARMRLSGLGDIATGPVLLVAVGHLTATRMAAFVVVSILAGVVFASFWTLCSCAAFWMGRADDVSMQAGSAMTTFSLYPEGLFGPVVRAILFLVVPAGLVGWLPASLVRSWSWSGAGLLVLGAALTALTACTAWTLGLRRYESGNLTQSVGD